MSRSYQKKIAWGKAKAGKMNRGKRNWSVKRNALGKAMYKNHWLSKLQTLDQFIFYVRNHCMADDKMPISYSHDKWDRKNWKDYQVFLDGRVETEELIKEFAQKLYNKDRSK